MAPRLRHLRVIASRPSAGSSANPACRIEGCGLEATEVGRCRACVAVYTTAEVLYRRLVAREMARLELRNPGVGRVAMAALQDRLARLDPPVPGPTGPREASWVPDEWELQRLCAFLAELRDGRTDSPGAVL